MNVMAVWHMDVCGNGNSGLPELVHGLSNVLGNVLCSVGCSLCKDLQDFVGGRHTSLDLVHPRPDEVGDLLGGSTHIVLDLLHEVLDIGTHLLESVLCLGLCLLVCCGHLVLGVLELVVRSPGSLLGSVAHGLLCCGMHCLCTFLGSVLDSLVCGLQGTTNSVGNLLGSTTHSSQSLLDCIGEGLGSSVEEGGIVVTTS